MLTIFPELVANYCSEAIFGRATRTGVVEVVAHDLRVGASDPHRSVDDSPFGGGAGMVLAPEPVFAAVERIAPVRPLYLMSPAGRRLDQTFVEELQARGAFSLLCGRYEGVDQRIADHLVDGEISIGDFVLAGGELAALAVVEAVARLVPGVVGNVVSPEDESFTTGLLEYPQYTRPAEFRGWVVPEVLRSGDHAAVERWRQAAALHRTIERRPDLIESRGGLSEVEVRLLAEHGYPLDAAAPLATSALAPARRPREGAQRIMNPTDLVDRATLRDDIPDFRPGDTVKVHVRVVEGNRERIQIFQGAVMRRQGSGARETFSVRKVSFGVGVERTFPVHSPILAKVEVVSEGDVRRAKLYYLRDRVGKAAKIKERRATC